MIIVSMAILAGVIVVSTKVIVKKLDKVEKTNEECWKSVEASITINRAAIDSDERLTSVEIKNLSDMVEKCSNDIKKKVETEASRVIFTPYNDENECSVSDAYTGIKYLSTIIPKESYIQLKNIYLDECSLEEQKTKLLEEINELIKIVVDIDTNNSFKHFCEETFDVLQTCVGIAEKKYGKSAYDVMNEYSKHILKMEQRGNKPREGIK